MSQAIPGCELLRLIGQGSYGEVWLARDTAGVYRAVKIISRASFEHDRPFEREYDGLRKFEPVSRADENQVQILTIGRQEGAVWFYYIMELADDQATGQEINPATYAPKTLKSELERLGRFSPDQTLRIGIALAKALENLHRHALIHRDIKPGNIIFVNGIPKLADIGLVTDSEMTISFVGTEGFIPPEGPGSAQGDIYSLGKVLYEMVTGLDRLDFPALPTDIEESPEHGVLLELNTVIAKACAREAPDRYKSADKMAVDLGLVARGKSVRRRNTLRRRLAVAAKTIAAAAAGSVLVLVFFVLWNSSLLRPQKPQVWELTKSRLTAFNPVGPVAYGTRATPGGTNFTLLNHRFYGKIPGNILWDFSNGPPHALLNAKDQAYIYLLPKDPPDPPLKTEKLGVIRWTAPAANRYEVKAQFACVRGREMAARVYVVRDGVVEFASIIRGKGKVTGYTNTFSLHAASVLDFVAGSETNSADWTGVKATITTVPGKGKIPFR